MASVKNNYVSDCLYILKFGRLFYFPVCLNYFSHVAILTVICIF